MNETYIEAGRRGKNSLTRYLLGIVSIVFMWFVVGGAASVALGNALGVDIGQLAQETSAFGRILGYAVINVPFPFFLLATLLVVALVHRRSPLTLVTGRRTIDWGRVGAGFAVWFALTALAGLVGFLVYPASYSFGPSLAALVPFALLALVFVCIQITAEELFFRGYVVQGASRISDNFVFLAITSGVLFMAPHLANPGMDAGFLLLALYHFGFGAFLAWVSLRDGSLELAIGAHAANNLFGAVVLGFEGSPLNTPTLFLTDQLVPAYSLAQFVVSAALFYGAFFVLFKRRSERARSQPAPRAAGAHRSGDAVPEQR